ncbi:MAG: copper resistance protein CopC [Hyphomicrobiales bacterium]|nr:copper resistance protein CopC [Hyphomicrobiales bacterium]
MTFHQNPASAFIFGTIILLPITALAHPKLVRSNPAENAKIEAPQSVSVWFSEKIQPVFNKIEVIDAKGAHFEAGKPAIDSADGTLMHVRVKQLRPGSYSVRWRASGADSHAMQGSFSFQVLP